MTTLTRPEDLLQKVLLHHAQLFRGLSLGYMHRALHEVDTESRARAESMADAYEIVATTLEASAQVEALPERDKAQLGLEQVRVRVAPVTTGSPSESRTDAASRSESAPDWKPAKRKVDKKAGAEKVRLEGRCRSCHTNQNLTRFHLVPRGQRGDDVEENIVPVCFEEHSIFEDHGKGWEQIASLIRASLSADELFYIFEKKGGDWINRRFPETV